MSPKICSSHLELLYQYLKVNNVTGVEEVEHELSGTEECVACTYLLKAKGTSKEVLGAFLSEQGFVSGSGKKGGAGNNFKSFNIFLGLSIASPVSFYSYFLARNYLETDVVITLAAILFLTVMFLIWRIRFRRLPGRELND